jgi:hypothetical protein
MPAFAGSGARHIPWKNSPPAPGDASGGGAIAGAIVGGVIGHQSGSGSGVYDVTVRMEKDGTRRVLSFDTPPDVREGDKVEVTGNQIERA